MACRTGAFPRLPCIECVCILRPFIACLYTLFTLPAYYSGFAIALSSRNTHRHPKNTPCESLKTCWLPHWGQMRLFLVFRTLRLAAAVVLGVTANTHSEQFVSTLSTCLLPECGFFFPADQSRQTPVDVSGIVRFGVERMGRMGEVYTLLCARLCRPLAWICTICTAKEKEIRNKTCHVSKSKAENHQKAQIHYFPKQDNNSLFNITINVACAVSSTRTNR
jgi:hypothetical protein